MKFVFLGSLLTCLNEALKLRSFSEPKLRANSEIFKSAFQMLNQTLEGSCHYVTMSDYQSGTGGWFGATPLSTDNMVLGDVFPGGAKRLPAFSLIPMNVRDLQKGLIFAQTFRLKVNMKVNGHNSVSAGEGLPDDGSTTMLFYMREFNAVSVHPHGFKDSCGTHTAAAYKVGGGTYFEQVYLSLARTNYTFLGGTCGTVSPGGGWILMGGLSMNQQRVYGLGVDRVLRFEVMLSTGQEMIVDRCSHPLLFKSLRGGGGGFAITLSVWYPLWPGTQLQYYQFAFQEKTPVNLTKWWEVLVRSTPDDPINNRWMIDPAAFSINNWGYPLNNQYITMPGYMTMVATFLGPAEEAEQTEIFQKFEMLLQEVPAQARNFTHYNFNTLGDFKTTFIGGWGTMGTGGEGVSLFYHVNGVPVMTQGPTGEWGIPMKFFTDHPIDATLLLQNFGENTFGTNYSCGVIYWYQFGGVIPTYKSKAKEVVLHPSMYDIAYSVGGCNANKFLELVQQFPDSGPDFNHVFPGQMELSKTDFVEKIWGKENYEFMLRTKQLYDPMNVFGCTECVAWPTHLAKFRASISNPRYMLP